MATWDALEPKKDHKRGKGRFGSFIMFQSYRLFQLYVFSGVLMLLRLSSASEEGPERPADTSLLETGSPRLHLSIHAKQPVEAPAGLALNEVGDSQGTDDHDGNTEDATKPSRQQQAIMAKKVRSLLELFTARGSIAGSNSNVDDLNMQQHRNLDSVTGRDKSPVLPALLGYQCIRAYGPVLQRHIRAISSLYQPLVVRHAIRIQEHAATLPYRALVLFGIVGSERISRLSVHVFEVEQNDGQTWRLHDRIDVAFLPVHCRDPDHFLPMVAPSMSREKVFIYGFGQQPECPQLIVYDPSKRGYHPVSVRQFGDVNVPTTFSAMTAIDTGAEINESLVVFGGTHCKPDEVRKRRCRQFSNDIFVFEFDNEDYRSGRWDVIHSDNSTVNASVDTPSARISSAVFTDNDSTLLVYGGISLPEGSGGVIPLVSECDVWTFDFRAGNWKKIKELRQNCAARSSESCFAENQIPMRAFAAYSTERRQLAVVNMAFSVGEMHFCSGKEFSVSQLSLKVDTAEWQTMNQTMNIHFEPKMLKGFPQKLLLVNFVQHEYSLYMVNTEHVTVENISVSFNFDTKNISLSWTFLPSQDRINHFPGNLGCFSQKPLIVSPPSFERNSSHEHRATKVLIIGGVCAMSQENAHYASWEQASWHVMPIWSKTVIPGPYTLRFIKPGPPFSHRTLHTPVLLEYGGVSKAVLYGGLSFIGEKIKPDVWCFDVSDQYWQKANLTSHRVIPQWGDGNAFAGHVAFAVTNTSFVIYGGVSFPYDDPLPVAVNDIFMFSFSNLSACQGSWMDLSPFVVGKPMPHRMLHTVALWDDRVYIAGGLHSLFFAAPDVSIFTLSVTPGPVLLIWKYLSIAPSIPSLVGFSLTRYTSDALLLLGGISPTCVLTNRSHRSECKLGTAYLIRIDSNAEGQHDVIPFFSNYPMVEHHVVGQMVYGGLMYPFPVTYDGEGSLTTYGVTNCIYSVASGHCPLGYGTENRTCRKCDMGFYSDSLSGVCQPCASFTVTKSTGSTSCFAPNPCYENFCHGNGKCLSDSSYKARCDCKWGYVSYDRCQVPLAVLLMSVSVIISTLVIIFVVYRVRSSRKISKQREKDLMVSRWQLRQLANGVIIKWDELQQSIIRQIGAGSGGNVYLAELSDMSVAVKVLRRCRMNDIIFLEQFSKEIELMRTVRHPNIVMFLGAGTQPTQHYEIPFIVMEYMTRESLSKVLQINRADITYGRRVSFALDIAKGMEFLHSSTTPRIHRDLKSSNMLVTSKWNVKIADFGMLRLLSTIQDFDTNNPEDDLMANCTVYRRCQSVAGAESSPSPTPRSGAGESTPLLPVVVLGNGSTETNLTQMMGSIRWCAPETLTAGVFNKHTDVYSYGVVLWEVLTHRLPYNDKITEDAVIAEITRGERLSFPPSQDAYHLKRLIEACWNEDSQERPLFPEIIQHLTSAEMTAKR